MKRLDAHREVPPCGCVRGFDRMVRSRLANMTISRPTLRAVMWLLIAVLAATLTYAAFRSYLSPELLIGFATGFLC